MILRNKLLLCILLAIFFANIDDVLASESEYKKISGILSASGSLVINGKEIDKSGIKQTYKKLSNKDLLWFSGETVSQNALKAFELLSKADENGLNSKRYKYKYLKDSLKSLEKTDVVKNDILLTQSVVDFVRDFSVGRPIPKSSDIDSYFLTKNKPESAVRIIEDFLSIENIDEFIDQYSPKHREYIWLKKELKNLLSQEEGFKKSKVAAGRTIQPSSRDTRVPLIRDKLNSRKPINPNSKADKLFYDKSLYNSVVELQSKFGLKPDGIIGPKTIEIINFDNRDIITKIKINMERWRWIPFSDQGKKVLVNIPEFKLYAYKDGQQVLTSTAIVGRTGKKTPIMNTVMTDVVYHPYWYAPKGYAIRNLVPQIKEDPFYIVDEEYTLIKVLDSGGWEVTDPEQLDWTTINSEEDFNYILRQDPGAKNALGPIKFNIKNNSSIYLHGTSEPWLFSNRARARSSGCIRLEDPLKISFYALGDNADFDQEKLERLYGAYANDYEIPYYDKPKHVKMNLEKEIPVYINYFTVFADGQGGLRFFEDAYGWDEEARKYLGV